MEREIINFRSELERHEELLGRQGVLKEMDSFLLGGQSRGWMLVKGGPGLGKSALLTAWLRRREQAGLALPPHHFLRRGEEDWNRPDVVKHNLAKQVEALYPEQVQPDAPPESRLRDLLQRVSIQVLEPRQERLVLVVDGLDEVEEGSDGLNPLPRFLPHPLPKGVKVLCASRPMPFLSWLEAQAGARVLDLDGDKLAPSNEDVVRQYCQQMARRMDPPLTPSFVEQVVQRAQGNVLYVVRLEGWLQEQPVEQRRAELLPRGLEALLNEDWKRIQELPPERRRMVFEGLGVLAVAREPLPLSLLETVAGWREQAQLESFLRVVQPFLREEQWSGSDRRAWRFFHEYFRGFVLTMLGEEKARAEHRRIAVQLCQWPVEMSDRAFHRSYALRHGVMHWLKAGDWERAHALYTNVGYLEAKCEQAGPLSIEEDLRSAAEDGGGRDAECPKALHRAIQAESHVLAKHPKALGLLVYNRLRCLGWSPERIQNTLHFPHGLPALRLRHPVKTGECERTLEGHEAEVLGCASTPDGKQVVSASADKTLKVWDVTTGRELATLDGHQGRVWSCAVMPDGQRAVSASADQTLRVWDVETGRELAILRGHEGEVNACAVTPDGTRLVSASDDKTLRVWDTTLWKELLTLQGHQDRVNGCAVTPDGRLVVSASADGTVKIWDLQTGQELATLESHEEEEHELERNREVLGCTVDGTRVVAATADKTLKVWDVTTRAELATLEGHKDKVGDCVLMPDGRRVVSASSDETLKVWDMAARRELVTLEGHAREVNGCAVTPDGKRVVSASGDRTLKVWEVGAGRGRPPLPGHKGRVLGCAVTPDGRRMVSASVDETLHVWDVRTGRVLATLKGHEGKVNGCAVTPDGRFVVSASDDGTLMVWDAETGTVLATLEGHSDRVRGCALLPDGRRVVSASDDKTLMVWDLDTGQVLSTLGGEDPEGEGHKSAVTGCAVLPVGHVVSASDDGTLKVWDVETETALVTLDAHEAGASGCAVLPDGRVVSTSNDGTLKVWNVQTQNELGTLTGHTKKVWGCAALPDGTRAVSASEDGTLKVWNVDSGQCLHTLHGTSAFLCVTSCAEVICAGDTMGSIWLLEPDSLPTEGVPLPAHALPSPPHVPPAGASMSVSFPPPLVKVLRSRELALFVGSGLSLGADVQGNFPTWKQLPQLLIDACERLGRLDATRAKARRDLFTGHHRLETMLSDLGSLKTILGRDYQRALTDIFRPANAAPGAAHRAMAQFEVRAILTTNYDSLLELTPEAQHRQLYTWMESEKALGDLESGRNVLLKLHGTAERSETVVMTADEYSSVRADPSFRAVLSHLLQRFTCFFIGYGMNDPQDLDLVLKWNADAFRSATRRHYALLKDPLDNDIDRYDREYNVQVIPYDDYAQLPLILQQLRTAP
jgi:WD40 repeat protein